MTSEHGTTRASVLLLLAIVAVIVFMIITIVSAVLDVKFEQKAYGLPEIVESEVATAASADELQQRLDVYGWNDLLAPKGLAAVPLVNPFDTTTKPSYIREVCIVIYKAGYKKQYGYPDPEGRVIVRFRRDRSTESVTYRRGASNTQ